MKSKIVFTMVLFSLLLNIFHDFFINNQIQTDVSKSIIVKKSTVTKHQYTLCDLHEVFHFSAILSVFPSIEPSFIKIIAKNHLIHGVDESVNSK